MARRKSMYGLWLVATLALWSGDSRAADEAGTVLASGRARSFLLHVPDAPPPPSGYPLVMAFHGGGMQGVGMARLTGLNAIAERRHVMVVYPDGIGRHWNDGRSTLRDPQDDVGFVNALIDQLGQHYVIDAKRIYATGFSNGALLVQRLGCELSARIAAIAPVAGTLPVETFANCRPSRALAVLQISGTDDPIMPYAGGAVKDFAGAGVGGEVASVERTVSLWATHNGCGGRAAGQWLPRQAPNDPTRAVQLRYTRCPAAGQVTLLSIIGAGHVWPRGAQPVRSLITGRHSDQLDASKAIIDFFLGQRTGP